MKYVKYIAFLVCAAITLCMITVPTQKVYKKTDFLLDTYITVNVYGKNRKAAADEILQKVRTINDNLSAFSQTGDVANINRAAVGVPVSVGEDCFAVLQTAQTIAGRTNGNFDITTRSLSDLWGFGTETPRVPTANEISETVTTVDYRNIILDPQNNTVTVTYEGTKIDLGGIAKGYAADCAIPILEKYGIKSACLDFGGNVVTYGEKPTGGFFQRTVPYTVGIRNPFGETHDLIRTVRAEYSPFCVVTSGGYERYFEQDGEIYHHILDPKTGIQPQNSVKSVTVIGNSAAICDGLSTAVFVGGAQSIQGLEDLYCCIFIVDDSGCVTEYQGEQS